MTKEVIIDTIKNTLLKVDEQGSYRAPFIEKHISAVYEQMFNEMYNVKQVEIGQYVIDYTESISEVTDMSTGYTLANLPINLKRVNAGLFTFATTTKTFVLTSRQWYKNLVDTDFDTVGYKGEYVATLRGDKVYANTSTLDTDTLTYGIIPKFTTFALTDEVMLPGGAEDHFIDRVIDTIRQMPPVDLINDNTI